jgi:hypothetical protein
MLQKAGLQRTTPTLAGGVLRWLGAPQGLPVDEARD